MLPRPGCLVARTVHTTRIWQFLGCSLRMSGRPKRRTISGRVGDHARVRYVLDGDRRPEGGARVLRRPFALHDRDHRQLLVLLFRRSRESGNPELRDLVARPWAPAFAGVTENIM